MVTNSEYTDSPFEEQDPSPVLQQARAAMAAGICVLPTVDGGKRPDLDTWGAYQTRLPTWEEINGWFPGTAEMLSKIGHSDCDRKL